MFYSFEEIREIADIVRDIDLRILMQYHSYPKDPQDNGKWHTPLGVISVNKQKFMNWTLGDGGGGAIDLAIHLQGFEYKDAVIWLYNNFSSTAVHQSSSKKSHYKKQNLKLPQRDDRNLFKVIHYLRSERCLPQELINNLIESGKLYADAKANAVFLLLGKKKKVAGAELRGTCGIQWRGMAPGSKKDMGCFYIIGVSTKKMILCESAIDAASCSVIYPEYTTISTSGVTANPAWLKTFITKGCSVYCGFDSDKTGNMLADKMLKLYPSIKRLRPLNKHDWNDVIKEYHT